MHLSDYLRLVVIEYVPPSLMALIIGFTFSTTVFSITSKLILGLISATFIVFGYNTFNAVYDKEIDSINKPNRPLPKGIIKEKNALYLSLIFFLISIILGYIISTYFFIITLIATMLAIIYSHPLLYIKKHFLIGTLIGNVIYSILFPLAGWAIISSTSIPWQIILILFTFGFGIGMLKDFEDIVGDATYKVHTAPAFLGYSNAILLSSSFLVIALLINTYLILIGTLNINYIIISIFVILALINSYILLITRHKKIAIRTFNYGMVILFLMELTIVILKLI